ncbi:CapA family protein [Micromonospora zhanjiangensis]|uniref:CapA family protein n=1 Tax=Micromonospora zhanjiangensis TaxID=1522057 RepID=A0ABV8KIW5_9ACTN
MLKSVPRGGLAAALVVVTLLTGCRDAATPAARWHAPETGGGSSSAAVPPDAVELRLAFAGDVHFMDRTRPLLRDPATAFGPIADTLRDADLTVVNLETAVTERGTPQPKTFHFRAPTTAYDAVRAAGVDAVSIANNHTLDYGQVGLLDTLDSARRAGFPVFGAGRDADQAYAPWLTTVRGVRIAVLGMSQISELASQWQATPTRPGIAMAFDTKRAVAAVAAARKQADLVIVYLHWGVEGNPCPSAQMKAFAPKLAAAGADIVVGTHAHTLLADGWLGRTYVHYGLGNFLWWSGLNSPDSGVLQLTVRGRQVIRNEFRPATVSDTGQPVLVTGAAERKIRDKLTVNQRCTGLSRTPG